MSQGLWEGFPAPAACSDILAAPDTSNWHSMCCACLVGTQIPWPTIHLHRAGDKPQFAEQGAKAWWENAIHQLLNSEMKKQKHPKAPCFSAENQCHAARHRLPSHHLPSRAPRPASRDSEVDAHSRSGCSDSVTACVRHTAKPSKSQRSAALIYKPHTLCAGTQASARARCLRPWGNNTWGETAQQARGSRTLRC